MNIFKRIWGDFSRTVIHDNRGIWPALAFLANPAFWAGVGKFIAPAAANMLSGKSGGGEQQGGQISQGQPMQQQPFITPQLEMYKPPSYGNIISQMLQRQRGF